MTSYKCSSCDFTRNTKGAITQHITQAKNSKKKDHEDSVLIKDIVKVECEICNKTFDDDKALKDHRKRCIEKKVLNVQVYNDQEILMKSIKIFTEILGKYEIQLIEQNSSIDALTNRIEKLEGKTSTQKINKRLITEEDIVDGDTGCATKDEVSFLPTSYAQIKTKFKSNGQKLDKYGKVSLTIKGFRNDIIKANVSDDGIDTGDAMYYYEKKRGKKNCEDLKIIITKKCEYDAMYIYEENKYCEECMNKIENIE